MSPALAGGFFTTEPPGKPGRRTLNCWTIREVQDCILIKIYFQKFLQFICGFFFFLNGRSGKQRKNISYLIKKKKKRQGLGEWVSFRLCY